MTRRDLLLAALAPGNGAAYTPVQVQKLIFLVDREAGPMLGGPFFAFEPYDYGPFDKRVYRDLEELSDAGLVDVTPGAPTRTFRLTAAGQTEGAAALAGVPESIRAYIERASSFVLRLSFQALVSAIYRAYPEMRARSVFRD